MTKKSQNKDIAISSIISLISNNKGEKFVYGRQLHEFLGSKQKFTDWINNRIKKYKFLISQDFFINVGKSTGGRKQKQYVISIDMAKHLAMLEANEKGHEARQYFISVESLAKKAYMQNKSFSTKSLTPSERILELSKIAVEQEKKNKEYEKRFGTLEQKMAVIESEKKENENYISIIGYINRFLPNMQNKKKNVSSLGKKASELSRIRKKEIKKTPHTYFGLVNSYHTTILEEVFKSLKND